MPHYRGITVDGQRKSKDKTLATLRMTHTSDAISIPELTRSAAAREKMGRLCTTSSIEDAKFHAPLIGHEGIVSDPGGRKSSPRRTWYLVSVLVDCCEHGQMKRTKAVAKGHGANGSGRDGGGPRF